MQITFQTPESYDRQRRKDPNLPGLQSAQQVFQTLWLALRKGDGRYCWDKSLGFLPAHGIRIPLMPKDFYSGLHFSTLLPWLFSL